MKTGFDASVPARKPKTQIGRVLTELTARPPSQIEPIDGEASPDLVQEAFETTPAAAASPPAAAPPQGARTTEVGTNRAALALHQDLPAREASAAASKSAAASGPSDWERLAALRERLAQAAQPRSVKVEPQHTAAAVRKLIDELRTRLEVTVRERTEVAHTLEATRAALVRAETDLEQERRIRADIEGRAEERGRVAAQAVAEAEALAAERDLVIGELAEQRRLVHEQAVLLSESEAALNRLSAVNEATARELAETRELHDLRAAEVADVETRIQEEAAERARVEARCRELEKEVARLTEAADAIEAIKSMVGSYR